MFEDIFLTTVVDNIVQLKFDLKMNFQVQVLKLSLQNQTRDESSE